MGALKETGLYGGRIPMPSAVSRSDILCGLEKYGYGLVTVNDSFSSKNLTSEEIIVHVLADFPEPRLIHGLPVVILTNKVDIEKLYHLSNKRRINNKLGYILDVCLEIVRRLRLNIDIFPIKKLRDKINLRRDNKESALTGYKSDDYIEFAKYNPDPFLRKWNMISLFRVDSFISQFHKYCLRKGLVIYRK